MTPDQLRRRIADHRAGLAQIPQDELLDIIEALLDEAEREDDAPWPM